MFKCAKSKGKYEVGKSKVDLAVRFGFVVLPFGLILELQNYYYVPVISRNFIFVSCLEKKRFSFVMKNRIWSIYIYMNEILNEQAHLFNCLYDLDLHNQIYNIQSENKIKLTNSSECTFDIVV